VSTNEAVCCEIQTHFGSSPPPRFTEKVLHRFSRFMCPKTKVFALKFIYIFFTVPDCKVYRKSYGHIITIYASKNKAVCCEVQTHFGSSPPARFTEKNSGFIFTICVSNKQTFLTSTFCKKLWPHFTILRNHKSLLCRSDTL